MTGIFLIAVLAVAFGATLLLSRWVTRSITNRWLRLMATTAMTIGLLSILVIDELIGGHQFRKLCRENAVLRIDVEKARGRTVKVIYEPLNKPMTGTAIEILHSHKSYRDVVSGEEIASNDWYIAKGGWFIQVLGISETTKPLTFEPTYCYPSASPEELANYGLTLVK